jgi:hypothetical protein
MVDSAVGVVGWIRTVDDGRRTLKRHSGSATGRFSGCPRRSRWRAQRDRGAAGRFQPTAMIVESTI